MNQTVAVGPNGKGSTYRFGADGKILSVTDAQGGVVSTEYDPVSKQPVSTTDELGHKTLYAYDASGNMTSITDPLGNVTIVEYEPGSVLPTV